MSNQGAFVPGLFSQAGRSTAFEIESLQNQLHLTDGPDDEKHNTPASPSSKAKARPKGAAKSQDDLKPRTPGGELAKAIQAKLRVNDEDEKAVEKTAAQANVEEKTFLTVAFSCQGKDGNYADKFTASYDFGSQNRSSEQRPENPYKVKHQSVLVRNPEWDFREHPKALPVQKPEKRAHSPLAFMTGVDLEDKDAVAALQTSLTARERSLLRDAMGLGKEKKELGTTMSLNSERGPLGKIGRSHHVIAQEVSFAYDSDLPEQDIKGYPKRRYPKWDFDAYEARKPLMKQDAMGEPGKYDVNLDSVKAIPKNVIGFGKALPRSVFVGNLGYIAPPAVLHPEEKRTRGLLPDRSRAKDNVRYRVTHVNDFDREMARPPLLTGASQDFHDVSDPAACEAVYQRGMTYDADTADIAVNHRRDFAPKYKRMLGRGREAVQGLRALSSDLAVRGSVGLGFVETESFARSTQEQRDAFALDGSKPNPNIAPRFDHRSVNVHNAITERIHRGAPLTKGSGLDVKQASLHQQDHPILKNAFKRGSSMPGFESRSKKYGGTRVLANSRSSTAISGWAPHELDIYED
jgi:hypothetical protein